MEDISLQRRMPLTFLGACMFTLIIGLCPAASARAAEAQPLVTLAPLDCMAYGLTPPNAQNQLGPSLPFYQPRVPRAQIDSVVSKPIASPTGNSKFPQFNHFKLWSIWFEPEEQAAALRPVMSWNIGEYTGFNPPGPLSQVQRGFTDSYGRSGLQLDDGRLGMWMNSLDPDFRRFSGTPANVNDGHGSMNAGCWYYPPAPLAKLFPTAAHQFDVAFDVGVHHDGSSKNDWLPNGTITDGSAQAYFQLIARNRQPYYCEPPPPRAPGEPVPPPKVCDFSMTVEFYTRDPQYATKQYVHGDTSGTLTHPIAQTGLMEPKDQAHWIRRMDNSMVYKTSAPFHSRVHFRMSSSQFRAVLEAVASHRADPNDRLPEISLNPLDYDITLLNVNGEIHDSNAVPGHAQLGMSVSNIRITSVLDHSAAGAPAGYIGDGSAVVFRNSDNSIQLFQGEIGQGAADKVVLSAGPALGEPVGYFAAAAPRVVYRDTHRAIREIFRHNGQWTEWNLSAALGAADAYSDPRTFVDSANMPHVVYRDMAGDIHELYMDAGGWHRANLSTESVPARPRPALGAMAYVASGSPRIVFRTVDNGIGELYYWNGEWRQWDMTPLAGPGASVRSDPQGFADTNGLPRVVYLDSAGDLHELRINNGAWTHTDLSLLTGAPKGLGNPMGFVAGNAARVVYRGEDGRIIELVDWNGQWLLNDLSATRGALKANADPMGFVDANGVARIVYRGDEDMQAQASDDNMLHELFYSGGQWLHRDL